MGEILVIGSTNMDIAATLNHLPKPGETVGNAKLFRAFGGKGANQAVAASRTGGHVTFAGCTGDDPNGEQMKNNLMQEGINVDFVSVIKEVPSGAALIFVDENGENCIAVAPGANDEVSVEIVNNLHEEIQNAGLIMLQLEIPYKTVQYICNLAAKYNTKVMLNPAPARLLSDEVLNSVEYLILNETEIEVITSQNLGKDNIVTLCKSLSDLGPKNIILTLGSGGSFIYNNKVQGLIPGFKVNAVDTTAAGDTFCGAFAAAITELNMEIMEAVRFANAAGALSVTKKGAQSSIPFLADIQKFFN